MTLTIGLWLLVLAPALLLGYAAVIYPALLWLIGRLRPAPSELGDPDPWPSISVVVPVYNEAASIRRTLDALLAIEYPASRRQILVVSDASTDATDGTVREYAHRGVELLRLDVRGGKTAAENASLPHLRGEIIVNTDATIRILPNALKPLIRQFQDPGIGVASGRDVSVSDVTVVSTGAESGYVGYEMGVRSLETRVGSIVGASGCFYAIRRELHGAPLPPGYSRDFAAALIAREQGFRAVSVDGAVCLVPRSTSLQREFRRKVRTMARGLQTLGYKRHLLNPFRYGSFAWMLWSHKLIRWASFPAVPLALLALGPLAVHSTPALVLAGLAGLGIVPGVIAMTSPEEKRQPRLVTLCGFVLASQVAGVLAWYQALRGRNNAIWEPTRRTA